jgi:hypothetical protein
MVIKKQDESAGFEEKTKKCVFLPEFGHQPPPLYCSFHPVFIRSAIASIGTFGLIKLFDPVEIGFGAENPLF